MKESSDTEEEEEEEEDVVVVLRRCSACCMLLARSAELANMEEEGVPDEKAEGEREERAVREGRGEAAAA
jgi:hypothetical protein